MRKYLINLFSSFVVLLLLISTAPKTYAVEPDLDSWKFVGLSDQSVVSMAADSTNRDVLYAGSQYIGGGPASGVFKSNDRGDNWTTITNGLPTDFPHTAYSSLAINPENTQVIYVGIVGNRHGGDAQSFEGIFKSTNGGANWTDVTPQGKTTSVLDIAIDPNNTSTIYIAGYHDCNGIWKSTDAGANWNLLPHPYCDATRVVVDPSNSNVLYASNGGFVIKSTDAGVSWTQVLSDTSAGLHGIALDPNDSSTVYAGSTSDGIYKSVNGGNTWSLLSGSPTTGNSVPSTLIADMNRNNTFYTMTYNTVNRTVDAGSSWVGINNGWPGGGYALLAQPNNDPGALYAGRINGGLYIYGLPYNPDPVTKTFNSSADSYLKSGTPNRNFGAGTFMRLQASGNNRSLVRFNQEAIQSEIGTKEVLSAKLRVTITDGGTGWGVTGRTIDIHRLLANWIEGNGTENDHGTGTGVTWSCSIDLIISNATKNCSGSTEWEMDQPNNPSIHPWAQSPTATQTIFNNQTGVVEFDITADVVSFLNGTNQNYGWLIKKTNEGQSGNVSFGTKESSSVPQLVIIYQP